MTFPSAPLSDRVRDQYFLPLFSALSDVNAIAGHRCSALSDRDWLQQGCLRVLSQQTSGRGHLQQLVDAGLLSVLRQTLQASLHSARRLSLLSAVTTMVERKLAQELPDPFAHLAALKGYHLYAADGHFHEHATHDAPIAGEKRPVQHFYALNLRTQALSHLSVALSGGETQRKREHDLHALKRLTIDQLRQQASVGEKVLYIYDRAAIDYQAWTKWKMKGIYFISREKAKHNLAVIGNLPFQMNDPINAGVISDDIVSSAGCISALRRVTYRCPESNEIIAFITNVFDDIPPGIIAYLYKRRWNIEKIFDTMKHSYCERKAWASGDNAKTIQARFICLQHNLACLFEQKIPYETIAAPHQKRAKKRVAQLEKIIRTQAEPISAITSLYKTVTMITQHPLRYLRWLRVTLEKNLPKIEAERLLERHLKLNL